MPQDIIADFTHRAKQQALELDSISTAYNSNKRKTLMNVLMIMQKRITPVNFRRITK